MDREAGCLGLGYEAGLEMLGQVQNETRLKMQDWAQGTGVNSGYAAGHEV